ncbi:MAG: YlxR family protein [Anaerolineae bacterium]
MSKRPRKQKPVPQRTCVACRARRPKRELVRIVRTPEGEVTLDKTGKLSGRGGYLCPERSCWEVALSRGQLERALRTRLTEEETTRLREYAANL